MFPPWEAHPATVHFPIAFLLGAVALDLYAWGRGRTDLAHAATWLIAAGTISGLLAVATGLLAFFTVPAHTSAAHGQMYWHLGLNAVAIVLFAAVFFLRRRPAGVGTGVRIAGLLAAAVLAAGAYLGGRLVYRGGAGVDPAILAPEVRGSHEHPGTTSEPGENKKGEPATPDPHKGH
ncbi:MAG: DUF2231 domain-containing protein [Gemmataceae bacterium]|nr:DUF2231 domain-containing protein [Gemmataceae bacterium]